MASLLTDVFKKGFTFVLVCPEVGRENSTPITEPLIMKALFSCDFSGTNYAKMRRPPPPPRAKRVLNHTVVIILGHVTS